MDQDSRHIVKRYSLAFKKQVVREYEDGASANSLAKRYGISNPHVVVKWVKKFSREGVRHKLMVIQSPEEQERIQELEERIAELEGLVSQLSLDKFMLESTLTVAEEQLGYEVKKKTRTPSSLKRKSGSKKDKAK